MEESAEIFLSEEDKKDIAQMCRAAFQPRQGDSKVLETEEDDFDVAQKWAIAQKKGAVLTE